MKKKARTKKNILFAIKRLVAKEKKVTLTAIAVMVGMKEQTLRSQYYDFITLNSELIIVKESHETKFGTTPEQKAKLRKFMSYSDKALGIENNGR